jgi:methylthioribose-1-phosphate isomerase
MNFYTLKFEDKKLILLDQTQLPGKEVYLDLTDYRDIIEAIKMLRVRGAPAIGVAAAYGCVVTCQNADDFEEMMKYLEEIRAARPTAVNLAWAVDQMKNLANSNKEKSLDQIRELFLEKARQIHEDDEEMCRKMGENGAEIIKDGMSILTHCNAGALATAGMGTALAVIYAAARQGKKIKVYADETRPLLQGARLTTWELMQENIDVTLNTDNMAASLMKKGMIDCVIVGADRVTKNFDVVNKIGTYGVAVLAKHHNIPFYVAIPWSTYDKNTSSGEDVEIEMRDPGEVTNWSGVKTAPEGVRVYSPAFDVTPHELVTAIITDTEVVYPNKTK